MNTIASNVGMSVLGGLLMFGSACAEVQRPASLVAAQQTLKSSDRPQLEASRPRLVKQAEKALSAAEKAYLRGDPDAADLYAQQAQARYDTAREFTQRDEALTLTKVMARAEAGEGERMQDTEQRAQALSRISELDARIAEMDGELAQRKGKEAEALRQARAVLQQARERQVAALEVGAHVHAPNRYEAGVQLLDSSVEALGLNMAEDAEQSATLALAAFEAAIGDAEAAKANATQQVAVMDAAAGQVSVADPAQALLRASAAQAIAAAEQAERSADALGKAQGQPLLQQARAQFTASGYDAARQLAHAAEALFNNKAPAPDGMAAGVGPGDLALRVEDRLVAMQFERAELIGRSADELCGADFRQFSELIELAERRLQQGDVYRAHEFIVRADERLANCRQGLPVSAGPLEAGVAAHVPKAPAQPRGGDDSAEDPQKNSWARRVAQKALGQAQADLAEAKFAGRLGEARLTEATALLQIAERWFTQGAFAVSERQAVAVSKLVTEPSNEAGSAGEGASSKDVKPGTDAGRVRAEKAIVQAEAAIVAAMAADLPTPTVAAARQQLLFAKEGFERGEIERAEKMAGDLVGALSKAQSAEKAARQMPATAAQQARCDDEWKRFDQASQRVEQLQQAALSASQQKVLQQAAGLMEVSRERLRQQACAQAKETLGALEQSLVSLPAPAAKNPEQAAAEPPKKESAAEDEGAAVALRIATQEALEQLAVMSERAAYVVSPRSQADFDAGTQKQTEARIAAANGDYEDALQQTQRAVKSLSRVLSSADKQRERQVTMRLQGARGAGGGDATLDDAYRAVYSALALRDEAKALRGEQDERVQLGLVALSGAQTAWKAQRLAEARAEAERASAMFLQAIEDGGFPVTPVAGQGAAEAAADYRQADVAVRKARSLQALCQRVGCAELDAEGLSTAQAMVESAAAALAKNDYAYAMELAEAASAQLEALYESARARQRPAEQGARSPDTEAELESAMREVRVQRKLCEVNRCSAVDYESFLRAEEAAEGALKQQVAGDFSSALALAVQAADGYRNARAQASVGFVVPADISSVSRSGAQLMVMPAIDFESGSSRITDSSKKSVADLATVMRANAGLLQELRVVGHTDSSGPTARNLSLSQMRARAVVRALRAQGVGEVQLSSEGRGESEPIASNDQAEGRSANRRVEFHLVMRRR